VWQTIETERLIIRPFADDDILALHEIMKKPEVMYAWEHGFSLMETTEYLHRHQER
jgi:RimJ/RimL family protein N-acetyltransferase